jgi:hypothetical protein
MKEAWFCYEFDDNFDIGYDPNRARVLFRAPNAAYLYAKVVRVVWAEILSENEE